MDDKVVRLRVCESRFESEMSIMKKREGGWVGWEDEERFWGPKMVQIAFA